MHISTRLSFSFKWRRACMWYLAFSWLSGLLLGVFAVLNAGDLMLHMMRRLPELPVSILGLLIICFPFLIAAAAVFFSRSWLLLPICFLKAFSFGYCGAGLNFAFGSAGWLFRLLLMFSDLMLIPLLCWFSFRSISGDRRALLKDLAACLIAAFLIGSLDYCVVSPFLAMLIDI